MLVSLACVSIATPAFAVTSSAVLLKCQKLIESRVRSASAYAAANLVSCTQKVVDCKLLQEIDGLDPTACLASASTGCSARAVKIDANQTANRDKALAVCGLIPTADVTPFVGGLGFFNVLATCGASDVTDLLTCIFAEARCSTERVLFRADPRAADSLAAVGLGASFPCVGP
jgi:hypothetical protein